MRGLKINNKDIYYSNPTGEEDILDADGNLTGEKEITYALPVKTKAYISMGTGRLEARLFGTIDKGEKKIIIHNLEENITPETIFWINNQITEPNDYKIKQVGKGLNNFQCVIERVYING